jgi:hypothetical protein
LLEKDGDDCVSQVIFRFGASSNFVVLGETALHNINFTVDYDNGLIGFSNGIDLTPVQVNYTYRVAIMLIIFGIITLLGICMNASLDKYSRAYEQIQEEKKSQIINNTNSLVESVDE